MEIITTACLFSTHSTARHCAQYWVFNTEQNSSSFPRPKKNILEANFCSYHNFPFPHHACPGNAGLRKGKNLEAESSHQAYNRDDTLPLLRWACAPRHIASLASGNTQVPISFDLACRNSNHKLLLPYPKSTLLYPTGSLTTKCSPKVSSEKCRGANWLDNFFQGMESWMLSGW